MFICIYVFIRSILFLPFCSYFVYFSLLFFKYYCPKCPFLWDSIAMLILILILPLSHSRPLCLEKCLQVV